MPDVRVVCYSAGKYKMLRSVLFITLAVSLLLWSARAFSAPPGEPEGLFAAIQQFGQQVGVGRPNGGGSLAAVRPMTMPNIPTPALPQMRTMLPRPVPAQSQSMGFIGALFRPAQYPQAPPPGAGYGYPPGVYPPEIDPALAYPPGHDPQDTVPERIVYVPYAAPPPIYVERFGKALRQKVQRGDAYLQEYPEMPLNLYTTRGPRDFLMSQPPSIGY